MFRIVGALFSGLFIVFLARWFYPGPVPMGWGLTILLGVGGSLAASVAVNRVGPGRRAGTIASVLGAMVLIFVGRHLGWH